MSVSRDNLDQLLSGYLDGRLSGDEQTRIDQLLRDDPEVARELKELQEIRSTLKEIVRIDEATKLDGRFSDRVLAAAIEQARTEGLDENHPLIRLAEQPSFDHPSVKPLGNEGSTPRVSWVRVASGLIALAASIAVAIVVLQPADPAPAGPDVLANSDPVPTIPSADPVVNAIADPVHANPTHDAVVTDDPTKLPGRPSDIDADMNPMPKVAISAAEPSAVQGAEASPQPSADSLKDTSAAELRSLVDANNAFKDINDRMRQGKTVSDDEAMNAIRGLNLMMVMDVRRTEAGRLSRVVREAMRNARISATEEKRVDDKLVGVLSQMVKESDRGVQVLYLEVSGKKFDYLAQSLSVDTEHVESVGMGMIAAPRVTSFMSKLKSVNPTEVRHTSWEFQDKAASALAGALSNGKYPAMSATAPPAILPPEEDGTDQMAQVLILIR